MRAPMRQAPRVQAAWLGVSEPRWVDIPRQEAAKLVRGNRRAGRRCHSRYGEIHIEGDGTHLCIRKSQPRMAEESV